MLLQNNGGIIDHIVEQQEKFIMVAGNSRKWNVQVLLKTNDIGFKIYHSQIVETYKQSYPLAKYWRQAKRFSI
jgi:hypothetical protein